MFYPTYLGGGDVPGMGGNNAYLAQARPNPLTDPRNKIKGGEPWGTKVLLPGEQEPGFQNWNPLLPPTQNQLPLAYGRGLMPNGSMPMGNAAAVANAEFYAGSQQIPGMVKAAIY
jgi:hypothetical protein